MATSSAATNASLMYRNLLKRGGRTISLLNHTLAPGTALTHPRWSARHGLESIHDRLDLPLIATRSQSRERKMSRSRKPANDEAWRAVVRAKSRAMPDGSFLYRYVTIDFNDGTTRKIRVDKSLWNSVNEGDTITKSAGSDPTKA